MDFPLVSIVSVVAICEPTASCPWWDSDNGPSWLFIIGCLIAFAVVIFLYNRFGGGRS
jgi:hypothetical protein